MRCCCQLPSWRTCEKAKLMLAGTKRKVVGSLTQLVITVVLVDYLCLIKARTQLRLRYTSFTC